MVGLYDFAFIALIFTSGILVGYMLKVVVNIFERMKSRECDNSPQT